MMRKIEISMKKMVMNRKKLKAPSKALVKTYKVHKFKKNILQI